MPKFGPHKPGAGRPKGSKTVLTRDTAERLASEGVMPLQVMVETMRSLWGEGKKLEACAIAEKAAPYMHPRLSAVDHSGSIEMARIVEVPTLASSTEGWEKTHVPQHLQ